MKLFLKDTDFANELADRAKSLYNISPLSKIQLLKCSENFEYLVDDPKSGLCMLLHINQNSKENVDAEILWMQELLRNSQIKVPKPFCGSNGKIVQSISIPFFKTKYYCTMFSYVNGKRFSDYPESELNSCYKKLGETAALLHQNSIMWSKHSLLISSAAGNELNAFPDFHDFRFSGRIGLECENLLSMTLSVIKRRLETYGKSSRRYGLIHGNLTLDNLYLYKDDIVVTNFENCGYGWFLSECGASLSPIMHKPSAEEYTSSWIDGYRNIRKLTKDEITEIHSFMTLHRIALLERILKNSEDTDGSKEIAVSAEITAALCEKYLSKNT